MFERPDTPHWSTLMQPLAEASMALGRLAHALETSTLHRAWLWRETARASAKISQIAGYRVQADRLMPHLAGVPLDPPENDSGLAAARRVFLVATKLMKSIPEADSGDAISTPPAPLWHVDGETPRAHDGGSDVGGPLDGSPDHDGMEDVERLSRFVQALSRNTGTGSKPGLIDLFLGLRRHAAARRLPPSLRRLALPLALVHAGILPKAAPALLAGRLPFGATRPADDRVPMAVWLANGLASLAREAEGAACRLDDLADRHRAWHARLADSGLRRHARTPLILNLLAATPVLSTSLVARHLRCSSPGAGRMLQHLSELGIVTEATVRSRWKIYLAGDLTTPTRDGAAADQPLAPSAVPPIDREAVEGTLDDLIDALERASHRTEMRLGGEACR